MIPNADSGSPKLTSNSRRTKANAFNRPDYAETLFGPDGRERDRQRLRRGADAIVRNPVWFAGVMIQRAAAMLRLERVPLISANASKASGYPTALLFQILFVTAVILPLIAGIALLVYARRWYGLETLLLIPVYYFLVQSALHTEYRYILALYHFLFSSVAITLYLPTSFLQRRFVGSVSSASL